MTSVAQAIAALARRRKHLLIIAVAVLALVYLPMFPYSPDCADSRGPSTVGSIQLAPQYEATLIGYLEAYEVPYVSIGRFVLLRFWTWLTDPDDWVTNASNKAVYRFVDKRFGASLDNIPQSVLILVEETRETYGRLRLVCPLVRAVAVEGF